MLCRGGQKSLQFRLTPWVDWSQYWGTGDMSSLPIGYLSKKGPLFAASLERYSISNTSASSLSNSTFSITTERGAAMSLAGTAWEDQASKTWPEMRLPKENPNYQAVGGDGEQYCKGDLIRARTLTGICNDILNPLMGSNWNSVRAQRRIRDVRFRIWGNGPHADRMAAGWAAHARSAGDQPHAVYPRPIEPGRM